MLNEAIQWMIIVALAVLVLGCLRQLSLLLPTEQRAAKIGPDIGDPLPRKTNDAVLGALGGSLHDGATLAFVTESCLGCRELLADIEAALAIGRAEDLVIVARAASSAFRSRVEGLGLPTIFDAKGVHWSSCAVTSTPLLIVIDDKGRVVRREVSHRVALDPFAPPPGASRL